MTDATRNQIIANYSRRNLSPTPDQRERITVRYDRLRSFLEGRCFQSGSYARFTAVRPPKDLDVIWVSSDSSLTTNPRLILDKLAACLAKCYGDAGERIELDVQDHSITIRFLDDADNFQIDVVPACELNEKNEYSDPIFCVPEIQKLSHHARKSFEGSVKWIKSDPKGYVTEASMLDEATEGRFRKQAKVVKSWRQKHKQLDGDDFRLKAFHAEQLVVRDLRHHAERTILEGLLYFFQTLNEALVKPQIVDRADPGTFIDEYVAALTPREKARIQCLAQEAYRLVVRIQASDDESEIVELLDELTQVSKKPSFAIPAVVVSRPPQPYCGYHE